VLIPLTPFALSSLCKGGEGGPRSPFSRILAHHQQALVQQRIEAGDALKPHRVQRMGWHSDTVPDGRGRSSLREGTL